MEGLEQILAANGQLGDELSGTLPQEEPVNEAGGIDEESADILAELLESGDFSDEEMEMFGNTAEELGAEFPAWMDQYLTDKDIGFEDEPEESDMVEEEVYA